MITTFKKLKKYFKVKRPYGIFSRYELIEGIDPESLRSDVPDACFDDYDINIEFRKTDTDDHLDVRYFHPNDPSNFVGYGWNIITGELDLFLQEGPALPNAKVLMESLRYIRSQALDFIMKIEE